MNINQYMKSMKYINVISTTLFINVSFGLAHQYLNSGDKIGGTITLLMVNLPLTYLAYCYWID